jgi:Immunity protein 35
MLTLEQAKSRALAFIGNDFDLSEAGDRIAILDDKTAVAARGWVFFYNSARFIETHDFSSMLMSNRPVFVDRETGDLEYVRELGSTEEVIEAYGGRVGHT